MCTDWLQRRAQVSPDREAVMDADTKEIWTYKQLNERAENLAQYFLKKGVQKKDRVCLISPNDISYLDFLFACTKIGAIFVPINYRLSQTEVERIFNDCHPVFIGLTKEVYQLIKDETLQKVTSLYVDSEQYKEIISRKKNRTFSISPVYPTDDIVIIYTSGSTGEPKGVVITHDILRENGVNTIVSWNLEQDDCTVVAAPMFHTSGLFGLTVPLLMVGGKVIIQRKYKAEKTLKLMEEEKCTIIFMVPTMYYFMIKSPSFYGTNLSAMKVLISGGAQCQDQIYRAFEARNLPFRESYGLTEAGPNNFYLDPSVARLKRGTVGRPMMFNDAKIVNENGKEVKPGEIGEIVLSGRHVFRCYWNKPKETDKVLKDGKLFTGDLARKDEDGYYYIIGRKKDIIISGGENVYPQEVEKVLNAHPAVENSVVLGIPDEKWGEMVVAMVCSHHKQKLTAEELQDFCRRKIGSYKIPQKIKIVDKLPLNGVGKIDKRIIREDFILNKSLNKSL